MKLLFLIVLCAILCIKSSLPFLTGAPLSSCESMAPGHPFSPQTGSAPIELVIPNWIVSNNVIPIIIRSTDVNFNFMGFKIQAHTMQGELIGTFLSSNQVSLINCFGISSSSATHTINSVKTEVLIEWEAPHTETPLAFNIFVTVVQRVDIFWVKQQFGLYALIPEDMDTTTPESDDTTTTTLIDTTTTITTEETTESIDDTTGETTTQLDESEIDAIYKGCGTEKVCFGIPDRCFINGNCDSFGAVTHSIVNQNDVFSFELLSTTNQRYIAMGLSKTKLMGDSSIIECVVEETNEIEAYTSWSIGRSGCFRDHANQDDIELIESTLNDGRIYCKVEKAPVTQINENRFDLVNEKYYLLLASGTNIIPNQAVLRHNTNREVSGEKVLLTNPAIVGIGNTMSPLLMMHGAFMIVSWIGLTSIGIVMARYFKTTWQSKQIFGKDVWFMWHVVCMFLTWALTLSGFIIIFIDMGEWRTSVHSVLGCVVFSLATIQAFGAIFRPKPKDPARPLFNWLHRAFGNITHLLAVITIFFAVGLSSASLPSYTLYILAAFVSFYLFMHIIFSSIYICAEMTKNKRLGVAVSKEAPYQLVQKTLFGLFVIIISSFVIGLILIYTVNFSG